MTTPDIDEQYCPTCGKVLDLLSRDSDVNVNQPSWDTVDELYNCQNCSQQYEYAYVCTNVIEK